MNSHMWETDTQACDEYTLWQIYRTTLEGLEDSIDILFNSPDSLFLVFFFFRGAGFCLGIYGPCAQGKRSPPQLLGGMLIKQIP